MTELDSRLRHARPGGERGEILETIFDHIPVMINFIRDRRVELVNRQWEHTLGWTLEEIKRDNVDVLSEVYPDPGNREEVAQFIAAGRGEWQDFKTRVRDGRTIDTTWMVVKLSDGTLIGFGQDITKRKRTEEALRRSREQLRALAAYLQSVREEERTRIARELHDDLGQALTGLRMELSWLRERLRRSRRGAAREMMERVIGMIGDTDRAVELVRRTATDLRPGILDLGLVPAIEWQAADFEKRTGITCVVEADPYDDGTQDHDTSTAVFRIVQEALTNAARHAQANRVTITLRTAAGALCVIIADNGRGITNAEQTRFASLGLLGMRERARLLGGDVVITGAPGRGTTIEALVPLTVSEHA